jgi:NMD protein affecting ribosome stability and mRNA decay
MTRQNRFGSTVKPRQDRRIREQVHDTYRATEKLPEPTLCPGCQAVYKQGRWQWEPEPSYKSESLCPACRRIRDDYPAGFVTLAGSFLAEHQDEILNLINNVEERVKEEHPTQRLMRLSDTDEGLLVTTTDMHLARGIGEALARAYQGDMDYEYNKQDDMLRVTWTREV